MGAKIGVLLNCGQQSQFSKVRREFDAVNLDPPMTCADWPVPGNLTLLHTQTAYTLKPWHRVLNKLNWHTHPLEELFPAARPFPFDAPHCCLPFCPADPRGFLFFHFLFLPCIEGSRNDSYVSTLSLSCVNSRFLAPSRFPAFHLKCRLFCVQILSWWNSHDSATSFQCSAKQIRSAETATYRYNEGHQWFWKVLSIS